VKIEADWISRSSTQAVMAALGEAWFVGGCVRNALMGLPVADIDIATPLLPGEVVRRAEAAGFKTVPTGIEHGTVTVIAKGEGFEVTTFRRDVSTDGRRASVAFSTDMAEDAARRDFTMNALYATADGTVVDPLGGLPDLQARHLRFVGQAEARIREDYLRILRFFRFAAHYAPDHAFDAKALAAIGANLDGLARLSVERVTSELLKLLSAPDPLRCLQEMERLGVLARILPAASCTKLPDLLALEVKSSAPADPIRRLAVLTADIAPLRLSRKEAELHALLRQHVTSDRTPLQLGYLAGLDAAVSAVLVRATLTHAALPDGWQADVARGAVATFPLKAADLAKLEGVALGRELARLKDLWLTSEAKMTRESLLAHSSPSSTSRL
jgi:poly(A) polymerase